MVHFEPNLRTSIGCLQRKLQVAAFVRVEHVELVMLDSHRADHHAIWPDALIINLIIDLI